MQHIINLRLVPTWSKTAFILFTLFLSSTAHAAVMIPSDLFFAGEYGLDLAGGGPGADQNGTFFARVAGIDSPGAYNNGSLISGNNPTLGILQEHGGGIIGAGDGFGGTANASITPNDIGPSGVFADTDLGDHGQTQPLLIFNNSLTDAYRVFFSLSYDHVVNALGTPLFPDGGAYAESDLEVFLNGMLLFEAEVISDNVFGNSINKTPTGGFGGQVTDSGLFLFNFLLKPQRLAVVELDYTLEGEDFEPFNGMLGSGNYFLSVDDVRRVPVPGAMPLMLSILPFFLAMHRRKKPYIA